MNTKKLGRIVWHDLFSANRAVSTTYYAGVAGWSFVTEHATDFAWGGGEKDFILALSGDEAGAGIAESPNGVGDGWIPYVEVSDVDAVAARATSLGGTVVKPPFDVPGVGRNCLLRDPLGALVGISLSRHAYPVPERQFGAELYLFDGDAFPAKFYAGLLDWKIGQGVPQGRGSVIRTASGRDIAYRITSDVPTGRGAVWLPCISVSDLKAALNDATALGGMVVDRVSEPLGGNALVVLRDPNGTLLALRCEGV